MAKTPVDVDAALLAHAQGLLGFGSRKRTVNRALAELIAQHRRREAVEAEIARFTAGHYRALASAAAPGGER